MSKTVKIGTYHLTEGYDYVWHDSETAAWYTTLRFEPQSVDVYATLRGRSLDIDSVGWKLTGTVIDEYHAGLFCGVPISDKPYVPRGIGETRDWSASTYGYAFAETLVAQRSHRDTPGYFVIDPDLVEISGRPVEWNSGHRLLPNPKCDCGAAIVRPATAEERASHRAEHGQWAALDYVHTDGTACLATYGNGQPRGSAWPAKDQWISFTEPGVHYSLRLAAEKVPCEFLDGLQCPCGNTTDTDGFDTCTPQGEVCEPDDRWTGTVRCAPCGRLYDTRTFDGSTVRVSGRVTGARKEAVDA